MKNILLLIILTISSFVILKAQTTNESEPTSSFEFNIGSMRPLGIYKENLPKEGLLDVGFELQTDLMNILNKESSDFPLSIGMKVGYNYFTVLTDKSGNRIYDTTGIISVYQYEFKYTLRAHALNFHPFLEIRTPKIWPVMLYAKGYFGPTTSWATSKIRYVTEDSLGAVTKDKKRDYSVNRWTIDYGYKIGVGFKLSNVYLTMSYTKLWGGEIEYLGKGSVKSFDPSDLGNVELEPIKSTTDRYIVHLGIKTMF